MALSCSRKTTGITKRNNLKNIDDFYCLNCLRTLSTENKLKCHEKISKNKTFLWNYFANSNLFNILKFNQYMKSDKTQCIIGDLESLNHVDLEFLIKK